MQPGDRVQLSPGHATGVIEKVREDDVAKVRWGTGARCPVPLSWLAELEDQSKAKRAEESAARKDRRHRERKWVAAHAGRECRGCTRTFVPTHANQVFHDRKCADRHRYLNGGES
jgi:hypothetical protein